PWGIPTWRAGSGPSPNGGSGTTVPDRLPSGKESRRRIARGTWSCRGATGSRVVTAGTVRAVAPAIGIALGSGGVLRGRRDQTEHTPRHDAIVFPTMD